MEYIVYDELKRKTDKQEWRDNTLNPKELLIDIMEKATELNYTHEIVA